MLTPCWRLRAISSVALMLVVTSSVAKGNSRQVQLVNQSIMVLDDITATNKKGLPPLLLRHSHAVAIFPNMIKGGFIFGGRIGEGVVLVRGPDGAWSYPIFVVMGGGSFGFQAGIQSTDLVLAFKNRQSVDGFLQGFGKLTLGVDGGVALGGLGRRAEVGTGMALKAQYTAFSRTRGAFLGASIDGANIAINSDSNALFYGRSISPQQIIQYGTRLPVPEPGLTLQTLLMEKTNLVPLTLPGTVVEEVPAGVVVDTPVAIPAGVVVDTPVAIPAPASAPASPREMILDYPEEELAPAPRRAPAAAPEYRLDPEPRLEPLEPLPPEAPARPTSGGSRSYTPSASDRYASYGSSRDDQFETLPNTMKLGSAGADPSGIPYSGSPSAEVPYSTGVRTARGGFSVDPEPYEETDRIVTTSGRSGWQPVSSSRAQAAPVQDSISGYISP